MFKRTIASAVITFDDGTFVKWKYIGKTKQLYNYRHTWEIYVRVEQSPSIEQFFQSWDKPSIHTANHFIKNAIKDYKELK